MSNLGKWLDLLGVHHLPVVFQTKAIDQWVAIGAIIVLLSTIGSWMVEYRILSGYVRTHGGDRFFTAVAPQQRKIVSALLITVVIFIIVFCMVAYSFLSRPYQLGEENANLLIFNMASRFPNANDKRFYFNFYFHNVGKRTAISIAHTNNEFSVEDHELTYEELDNKFEHFRDDLKGKLRSRRGSSMDRGTGGYYTYVFEDAESIMPSIDDGTKRLYIYWVELYKDDLIPQNEFIATEVCGYILPTHAMANCEVHNIRTLIR